MSVTTRIAVTGPYSGGLPAKETTKTTRRRKDEERAFSPPDLGYTVDGVFHPIELRSDRFELDRRLLDHFYQARNNREYRQLWEVYRATYLRDHHTAHLAQLDEYEVQAGGERKMRVRASELKECSRKTFMRLAGFNARETGADTPHWSVSAVYGDLIHLEVEAALTFLNLVRASELSVTSDDGTLSGRIDHIIDTSAFPGLGVDALPAVIDVKSVGTDDFDKLTYSPKVPGYVAQVSAYGRIVEASLGIVLLADRGKGRFLSFEFDIIPEYGDRVLLRAQKIVERVEDGRLPKAEEYKDGKPTFFCFNMCPFFRQCSEQEATGAIQEALDMGVKPEEL